MMTTTTIAVPTSGAVLCTDLRTTTGPRGVDPIL